MKRNNSKKFSKNEKKGDGNEKMRLNKYISNSGLCSRREADTLISEGKVKVNNKIITELGHSVTRKDEVKVNNKIIRPERFVYILLNKPRGYITTTKDPEGRKTVMDIVDKATQERVYPVGRLDRDTTGVLLLTNDGDLTNALTHPSGNVPKIYAAELDKPFDRNDFLTLAEGITLDDGFIKPDDLAYTDDTNRRKIGIQIHSGRNRIIRRIFEHMGYNVEKLDRVMLSILTKKNLPRGKWRFLTEKEVNILKRNFLKEK